LPSPSSEFDFLLSRAQSLSIPIQAGRELSRSFAVFGVHYSLVCPFIWGCFVSRDFRHHILPCQRDGNSKPASVLLIIAQGFLAAAGSLQIISWAACKIQASQHFSKYGCTPQMTGLAPFGLLSGISLARHKVTILFVPCWLDLGTNPFILLFGTSLLPSMAVACGLLVCLNIITCRILTTPNSYLCPFLAFIQSDIPPQRIAAKASLMYGSMPNKAARRGYSTPPPSSCLPSCFHDRNYGHPAIGQSSLLHDLYILLFQKRANS
jgi:hypothetical protein